MANSIHVMSECQVDINTHAKNKMKKRGKEGFREDILYYTMAQFTQTRDYVSADFMHHFLFASVHLFSEAEREKENSRNTDDSATVKTTKVTTTKVSTTTTTNETKTSTNTKPLSPATTKPSPAVVRKLENMGFCVGRRLIERQTRDSPPKRLENNMSIMRYICKDFWPLAFDHGATRLRTNHRGIFVIEDSSFRFIESIGSIDGVDATDAVRKYLIYPCGLLRGALASLGVACIVDVTVDQLPTVQFQVECSPMVPSRA